MSKGPRPFRQRDLTRAIKGAIAAGLSPSSATIDRDGNIKMHFSQAPAKDDVSWDNGIDLWHGRRTGRTRQRPTGT
jgi:hypothetical protein